MRDVIAILGVLLAAGVVVAIPIGIVRFQRGLAKERLGELTLWATGHGMQPSNESAVPIAMQGIYAPAASFVWRGGVLSVYTVSARGDTTHSLWWIPTAKTASGPTYATANRFGSSIGHTMPVIPTNDGAFDDAFAARAQDASSVPAAFSVSLRAAMLRLSEGLDTVSWDGTRWSVTQRSRGENGAVWDRALALFEAAIP